MKKIVITLLMTGVCGITMPSTSKAGFQFTAPIQSEASGQPSGAQQLLPIPGDVNSMPATPTRPVIQMAPSAPQPQKEQPRLKPEITFDTNTTSPAALSVPQPDNIPAAYNINTAPKLEYAPNSAQVTPQAHVQKQPEIQSNTTKPPLTANETSMAIGFGNDLPLVTALRQIIPPNYTYVLDSNIETGKTVSWNGGRAWPLVLSDATSQAGLNATIDGTIVHIKRKQDQIQDTHTTTAKATGNKLGMSEKADARIQPFAPYDSSPENMQPQVVTPVVMPPQQTASNKPMNAPIDLTTIGMAQQEETDKSVVQKPTEGQWMAQSGSSLRSVIESWAELESVDLFWSTDYDYKLAGDVNISGNFEQAIKTLLEGFSEATPAPLGRLHPNLPHGPAVLVIETHESNL